MATDLIQSAYRRTWWALVLRGLLALALGVFIFGGPWIQSPHSLW